MTKPIELERIEAKITHIDSVLTDLTNHLRELVQLGHDLEAAHSREYGLVANVVRHWASEAIDRATASGASLRAWRYSVSDFAEDAQHDANH